MNVPASWLSPLVTMSYSHGASETGGAQVALRDGTFARVSGGTKATFDDMVTPSAVRFRELGTSLDQAIAGAKALAASHTTAQGATLDVAVALLRDQHGVYFATPVGRTTVTYDTVMQEDPALRASVDIGSAFGIGRDAAAKASAKPVRVPVSVEPFWFGMGADPDGHARSGVSFLNRDVVAVVGASSVVLRPTR